MGILWNMSMSLMRNRKYVTKQMKNKWLEREVILSCP